MTPRRDYSAGGLAVDGDGRVAVIRKPGAPPVWGLPKGHPLPGEDSPATALREVAEETGLSVVLDHTGPPHSIHYRYRKRSGVVVDKRVDFYLMRVVGGDPAGHDDEVAEVALLEPAEAIEALSYANERDVVRMMLCE